MLLEERLVTALNNIKENSSGTGISHFWNFVYIYFKFMKVHFIGIGGIGTSALASYFLHKGHKISGSDLVASEVTDDLKRKGVRIIISKRSKKLPKVQI